MSKQMERCPKCSAEGQDISFRQISVEEFEHSQHRDGSIGKGYRVESLAMAERIQRNHGVRALCGRCHYEWRLRDVARVYDLPGYSG